MHILKSLSIAACAITCSTSLEAFDHLDLPVANDFRIELAIPIDQELGDDFDVDYAFDLNLTWQFRSIDHVPGWFSLGGAGFQLHAAIGEGGDYYAPGIRGQFGGGYRWKSGNELLFSGNIGMGVGLLEWQENFNSAIMFSYGAEAQYLFAFGNDSELSLGLGFQGRINEHEVSLNATQTADVDISQFYPTAIVGWGWRF